MTVCYEFDIEIVENEEIIGHYHDEKVLPLLSYWLDEIGKGVARLVLVKNVGNDLDGLTDRSWAYVENYTLPDTFEDGSKVPTRFKRELEIALTQIKNS